MLVSFFCAMTLFEFAIRFIECSFGLYQILIK